MLSKDRFIGLTYLETSFENTNDSKVIILFGKASVNVSLNEIENY